MSDVASALFNIGSVVRETASYLPEPATQGVSMFSDVMDIVKSLTGNGVGGVPTEIGGDFMELLELQIQTQLELQTVSMVSNVEKSEHESKMAAIRNVRVN